MELTWKYSSFKELTVEELYEIMRLRNGVFVVEQNCVYQDADKKDAKSYHLAGWLEDELVAYCRVLPPGLSFEDSSIGRVVTSPAHRKSGFGRELVQLGIEKTLAQYNCSTITIGAQLYLRKFYESLGFVQISPEYLEDNIPHIDMRYTA
ncbi:MAG: GNAT family N-acetyltransferase [Ferruginibacter sp.]|nr:GNAT family N-acetyltransferase [Ferruginibacter sp.]